MQLVAVNEMGRRVGDSHHNAKLTNHEVEMLLTMHGPGFGYGKLASIFEISKSMARNYIKGRARCQSVHEWRTVHVKAAPLITFD